MKISGKMSKSKNYEIRVKLALIYKETAFFFTFSSKSFEMKFNFFFEMKLKEKKLKDKLNKK